MPYRTHYPYDEVGPEEYMDRPPRTAPGQATPPPAPPLTPEEAATAAADCRALAAEHHERAARLRAKGDGYRVQALAAESSAARYEFMADGYERKARRG